MRLMNLSAQVTTQVHIKVVVGPECSNSVSLKKVNKPRRMKKTGMSQVLRPVDMSNLVARTEFHDALSENIAISK